MISFSPCLKVCLLVPNDSGLPTVNMYTDILQLYIHMYVYTYFVFEGKRLNPFYQMLVDSHCKSVHTVRISDTLQLYICCMYMYVRSVFIIMYVRMYFMSEGKWLNLSFHQMIVDSHCESAHYVFLL